MLDYSDILKNCNHSNLRMLYEKAKQQKELKKKKK